MNPTQKRSKKETRDGSIDRFDSLCQDIQSATAEYPSGLRGRIANPLFVGSNPTSAFELLRWQALAMGPRRHRAERHRALTG